MPIYTYQCIDCGAQDQRLAGLDDHTALCAACGGLMLRLDEDLFAPYFAPDPLCPWCLGPQPLVKGQPVSHGICARHAAQFAAEVTP